MTYKNDKASGIIEQVFKTMPQLLDERQRRLWAASIAKGYGHGGIKLISDVSGMDVRTIRSGLHEIEDGLPATGQGKIRKSGANESWNYIIHGFK